MKQVLVSDEVVEQLDNLWKGVKAMEAKEQARTVQESGFVIEDRAGGQPVYYDATAGVGGAYGWTQDKSKGLRFARRIDGERFIAKHLAYAVGAVTVVPS